MEHEVAWHDIVVGFCLPLCIDVITHIRQLFEQVEAVYHEYQIAMKDGFAQVYVTH